MKICLISDTHSYVFPIDKDTDLLLHAGDFFHEGRDSYAQFLSWNKLIKPWLQSIADNGTKIIACAGNHDHYFEENRPLIEDDFLSFGGTYIEHGYIEYKEIIIAASSYQPIFYNWAFNKDSKFLQKAYRELPFCHILLTHCPPWGRLDISPYGFQHAGSTELSAELNRIKPRLHAFGHIHSGYGIKLEKRVAEEQTLFVNAAVTDEKYQLSHQPIYLNWQ